jgi:hypothetical protein
MKVSEPGVDGMVYLEGLESFEDVGGLLASLTLKGELKSVGRYRDEGLALLIRTLEPQLS